MQENSLRKLAEPVLGRWRQKDQEFKAILGYETPQPTWDSPELRTVLINPNLQKAASKYILSK